MTTAQIMARNSLEPNRMIQPLDIAISGAGPAGLAAALFLARDGHRVTLFERFGQAQPLGSGLMLQPTGLAVLHDLGLLDAILQRGQRIGRLTGRDAATGRTVLDVRYDAVSGGRFGLGVHRAALFGVLHEAVKAAGIAIVTGAQIVDTEQRAGAIRLIDAKGRRHGPFALAVDASGGRSALRRATFGPSAEPRPLAWGALWGTVDWCDDGFDIHALEQRYEAARVMIGVLPLGRPFDDSAGTAQMGRKAALFWSLKPADHSTLVAGGFEELRERIIGCWPQAARAPTWRCLTPPHWRMRCAGRQTSTPRLPPMAHRGARICGFTRHCRWRSRRSTSLTVRRSPSCATGLSPRSRVFPLPRRSLPQWSAARCSTRSRPPV